MRTFFLGKKKKNNYLSLPSFQGGRRKKKKGTQVLVLFSRAGIASDGLIGWFWVPLQRHSQGMLGFSYGELFLLLGATAALIGTLSLSLSSSISIYTYICMCTARYVFKRTLYMYMFVQEPGYMLNKCGNDPFNFWFFIIIKFFCPRSIGF